MLVPNPQYLFSQKLRSDPVFFINRLLGIPLHKGQIKWLTNATKKINILRPGNRWGKSIVEAAYQIWHLMTKPNLPNSYLSATEWLDLPYETVNFGPAYEQAREVPRLMKDIIEGKIQLPEQYWEEYGRVNKSMLKGWAIMQDRVEQDRLPNLKLITGGNLLIRSFADMGGAFKAKAVAFISGDECADINELWTFTNITLLPRLVSMHGIIHFVGTAQPEGYDYATMIEMAEEDMEIGGKHFYVQRGTMYDNPFLDRKEIEETEAIADPDLRRQIIQGEYVEKGDKYYGAERVANAFRKGIGFIEHGEDGHKYLVTVDFAGGKSKNADLTIGQVIDYTTEPYYVVYFWHTRGRDMPIPMQYAYVEFMVTELFPGSKLIIDGTSLGGKNAQAFLKHLHPIVVDINGPIKAEIVSTLKWALDGGPSKTYRRQVESHGGARIDLNDDWGLIRIPDTPETQFYKRELMNNHLDDSKIKNDCVMSLGQGIWWIEMRRPKVVINRMVAVDWVDGI